MYSLRNENIIAAGGPMHLMAQDIQDRYIKYFSTITKAKQYAEREYGEKIEWVRKGKGLFRSPDLGHTMYHIKPVEIEE